MQPFTAYPSFTFDGSFGWIGGLTQGVPNSTEALTYLQSFYTAALAAPSKLCIASCRKGFNDDASNGVIGDNIGNWGNGTPRILTQNNGGCWLDSFTVLNSNYSAAKQLPILQIPTWDDYEEGSEIETGIATTTAFSLISVIGFNLTWQVTGNLTTNSHLDVIDHYEVWDSVDAGANYSLLYKTPDNATMSFDLTDQPDGDHVVAVRAIGKPCIQNVVSDALSYTLTSVVITPPPDAPPPPVFSIPPPIPTVSPAISALVPSPFTAIRSPIADKNGNLHRDWQKWFQTVEAKTQRALDIAGEIAANAKIQGRTEGIGTTVGNIDSTGVALPDGIDFARSYVNKQLDSIPDGATFVRTVPNEKTGGGRAFSALDANARLADTTRGTMAIASYTPITQPVTQHGTSTQIDIASSTQQFPTGVIAYSSGSVDPGGYGLYYIYADDPLFAGGAVAYQASLLNPDVTSSDGRAYFGKITTAPGGGGSGSGGGGGACFSGNTLVITKAGIMPISLLSKGQEVLTQRGWRSVRRLLEHKWDKELLDMGNDEYVTTEHRFWFRNTWTKAKRIFGDTVPRFTGPVFNLDVCGDGSDEEQCYTLANGHIAHNALKL